MTREEAIGVLLHEKEYQMPGGVCEAALDMAIAALAEQVNCTTESDTVKLAEIDHVKSGWISVKRPPTDEQRVLVKVPEILGSPHVDTDRFVKGRWVRWGEKVTHWKPLQEEEPTHDEA